MKPEEGILKSELGWMIIDALRERAGTRAELREKTGSSESELRSALDDLKEIGVVSSSGTASAGDPYSGPFFSLSGQGGKEPFPPRNYMFLSEAIIRGIVKSLGPESARMVLRDIGLRAGEDLAQSLLARSGQKSLDPTSFVEHFVQGALGTSGAYPRLIRKTRNTVEFEQLNCPFQDMAERFPGLMCDAIDEGMHEGLDRQLSLTTERLLCKGHSDASCRFLVTWNQTTSSRRSSRAVSRGRPTSGST